MEAQARHALKVIRDCISADRFTLARHFQEQMDRRGFVWADILAVVDAPAEVRDGGPEDYGRPKWIVGGTAADGLRTEVVCVLDRDAKGDTTVFITLY